MTTKQKLMVKRLVAAIKENDFYGEGCEFKQLTVKTNKQFGYVELYCESGLKNDEGTLAACCARTTRQIFIGVNGGLRCYNNRKKNGKAVLRNYADIIIFGYYAY